MTARCGCEPACEAWSRSCRPRRSLDAVAGHHSRQPACRTPGRRSNAPLPSMASRRHCRLSEVRKYALACPAIPTCGLALSEAERVLPNLIDEFETVLDELGLSGGKDQPAHDRLPQRLCPPYQSDIGIVGRSGNKYTIFVGGSMLGNRLNFVFKDLVLRSDRRRR